MKKIDIKFNKLNVLDIQIKVFTINIWIEELKNKSRKGRWVEVYQNTETT